MMNDNYPEDEFTSLHDKFKGRCKIPKPDGTEFIVNLTSGECSCNFGAAYIWDQKDRKWISNKYCIHKLKALSSLVDNQPDNEEIQWAYIKALSTRYNRYEVVSAFHKELRKGDAKQAWFWGSLLIAFRGKKGVIEYMMHIVYEETRDYRLNDFLIEKYKEKSKVSLADVCRAVRWMCKAKKKWALDYRLKIFEAEMQGYKDLVAEYGKVVAKPGNVIASDQTEKLFKIFSGRKDKSWEELQKGVKGIQKLKHTNPSELFALRLRLLNALYDYGIKDSASRKLKDKLIEKDELCGIGYHDINMFADYVLHYENEEGTKCKLNSLIVKKLNNNKKILPFPTGKWPGVPLYAQDNHTWAGKSLIRRFPSELLPSAEQKNLDLRICGAYFGVAWRMLAYRQHDTIDIEWKKVKWPKWLHTVTQDLWY